jgi:hypothetical protein
MRVEQNPGIKGSLKWIQAAVARPAVLDHALRTALDLPSGAVIDWRSPRGDDAWAEYRDGSFLEALGLARLAPDLKAFWPRRGPQWDALARVSTGDVILGEATYGGAVARACSAMAGQCFITIWMSPHFAG